MSARIFAGVIARPGVNQPTVVAIVCEDGGLWTVRLGRIVDIPPAALIAVDRMSRAWAAVELQQAGYRVHLATLSVHTWAAIGLTWSPATFEAAGEAKAALDAALYRATGFACSAVILDDAAQAVALALSIMARETHPRHVHGDRSRSQDCQARGEGPADRRLFGVRLALPGGFEFVFGLRQQALMQSGRKDVQRPREVKRQGDQCLLGRRGWLAEKIVEHQGVSKVAGCGTATGARVAGRSEHAAGDDREEAALRPENSVVLPAGTYEFFDFTTASLAEANAFGAALQRRAAPGWFEAPERFIGGAGVAFALSGLSVLAADMFARDAIPVAAGLFGGAFVFVVTALSRRDYLASRQDDSEARH